LRVWWSLIEELRFPALLPSFIPRQFFRQFKFLDHDGLGGLSQGALKRARIILSRATDGQLGRRKYMKVYVGNLPWSVTDTDLLDLFKPFGDVDSAQVVTDRESGRSRGFGFVEMAAQHAIQAIAKLNGHAIESRQLRVNEAQSKQTA
jgi:hypothetical protein